MFIFFIDKDMKLQKYQIELIIELESFLINEDEPINILLLNMLILLKKFKL